MTTLVVVIPCSAEKLDYDPVARAIAGENPYVSAGELYIGAFHRYARQHAERIADEVLVMSAWHGLIRLDFPIAPYDMTIDHPNSITARPSLITHQAVRLGLLDVGVTVASWCPAKYTGELARAVPGLVTPFSGSRGIGDQRGRIARATRAELLGEPVGQLELLV